MQLDDYIIHPTSRKHIEQSLSNFPQSTILAGPSGTGIATIAKAIARSLGSAQLVITPKKKSSDGSLKEDFEQGSMVIDDIRALKQRTKTKVSQKNVYVFDFGDRTMTTQAQNSFLKLLEEPREGYYFILATHRPGELLPTITSRSQLITVLPCTNAQTNSLLDTLGVTDATKRARLAFVANGLPATLTRLAQDEDAYNARVAIMQDAKTLLGGTRYDKLVLAHTYKDRRADALTLLDDVTLQLKTMLRARSDPAYATHIDTYLAIRELIANSNANVRLQLARAVL